jgi:hypothetical protein
MHKLFNSVWNKEELPQHWNESIVVSVYKRGYETDCSNYTGVSLLPTPSKMLSNILISNLTPYIDEIIGNRQCGFRHNRSTHQIFCIRHMLEKKKTEKGVQWHSTPVIHRFGESL